jgi:5-methylcytosine-specific restriction endonuclease McrA
MKNITEEKLLEIVKTSNTIADICRAFNLLPRGSNYKTIKKYLKLYNIDTSHFLGFSHMKGKTRADLKIKPLKDYMIENSTLDPSQLKIRLLRENLLEYKCNECGITTWNEKELVLHLDHINGTNDDHRLENLRLLCPNCHSQTNTYCGRNAKHLNAKRIKNNTCQSCSIPINKYAEFCRKCSIKFQPGHIKTHATKIDWPTTIILIELIKTNGYTKTSVQLGVSTSSIAKRIKNHPND